MWPGSFGMCEFIAKNGATIFDRQRSSVFELGAGSGILGLVVAQFAKDVTLTDGDKREVLLLRENAQRYAPASATVSAQHLPWGWKEAEAKGVQRGSADFVIGAEVCYVPDCIPLLVETIDFLLSSAPHSAAYIANCCVSSTSSQAECRGVLASSLAHRALHAVCLRPFPPTGTDASDDMALGPHLLILELARLTELDPGLDCHWHGVQMCSAVTVGLASQVGTPGRCDRTWFGGQEELPFAGYFHDESNNRGAQPTSYLLCITRQCPGR